jgi:hypothetical protein
MSRADSFTFAPPQGVTGVNESTTRERNERKETMATTGHDQAHEGRGMLILYVLDRALLSPSSSISSAG